MRTNMELQPHQQRVLHEKTELGERLKKLHAFIGSREFNEVQNPERTLLLEQAHHMTSLFLTLTKRTSLWIATAQPAQVAIGDQTDHRLAIAIVAVARYKSGNTALIEALMRFAEGQPDAGAFAQPLLGECGMLNEEDGSLDWAALESRKPAQQTWEQAVRECVTDPAEVERLLALEHEATHEEIVAAMLERRVSRHPTNAGTTEREL